MDDKNARILSLIDKFELGLATDQDMQELETWFQSFEYIPNVTDKLNTEHQRRKKSTLLERIDQNIDLHLAKAPMPPQPRQMYLWTKLMVAASVLIISALGACLFLNKSFQTEQPIVSSTIDFAPGSKKAILTLGSGKQITLNDAQNGELANQGNATICKSEDGAIVYSQNSKGQSDIWNMLSTPRGGQYHLVLADGTKAYLNASSSIRYPASFTGNFREVQITGEVYFEVAHNASKPFRVKTGTQMVEVLGTHFNINAYQKAGAIKTTLLEGSVAVRSSGSAKVLKPGQQAVFTGNAFGVSEVDIDEVTAWKNGFFDFTNADIQTVMQEFSRWYDLDIVFDGPQTKETFTGRIPRSWSFAKVMKIMETFKSTHITVEGRRIVVRQ